MKSPVSCQCTAVLTTFATFCTLDRTCMNFHMLVQAAVRWITLPTLVTRVHLFYSLSFAVRCRCFLCCKHCTGCTQILHCWIMPSTVNVPTFFIKGAPCMSKTHTDVQRIIHCTVSSEILQKKHFSLFFLDTVYVGCAECLQYATVHCISWCNSFTFTFAICRRPSVCLSSVVCLSGFRLYSGTEIKNFQGRWSCIFKEQFSTKVYSMDNITAIFNIYFWDYGTVLVAINKARRLLATLCFRQNTCLTKLMISHSMTWRIQGLSRTCDMKFKDFQATVLFLSTFIALNLGEKNSSTF